MLFVFLNSLPASGDLLSADDLFKHFDPDQPQQYVRPCPKVINLFPCSTQLSTKFQMLINTKILTNKKFLALCLSDFAFSMLIKVKMPTIVGILTFISRINFVLS